MIKVAVTDQIKINLNTLIQMGVCLHASSVSISGKAILFLGHSTSGKSTISRLLSERYRVIADDKVWVHRLNKSKWLVHDASDNYQIRKQEEHFIGRDEFQLLAISRIFKSDSTRMVRLSSKELCKYLMDAIFEIDFQRKIEDINVKKKWFSLLAEMAKNVEGWGLTFTKDVSIIKKIHDIFEKDNKENAWNVRGI